MPTGDDVKARGGVSCIIAREYLCLVKSIMTDIPENIVINFKNGDAVFGSYISPLDSHYFNVTDFSNIANMFLPANAHRCALG